MAEEQQIESSKLYDLIDWAHKNRHKLTLGVGAVAGIGIAVAIFTWRSNENESAANRALLAIPAATATSDALLKVSSDYPGTIAGQRAALLGASHLFNAGKFAEAQAAFSKVATDAANATLLASAEYGVATSLDALGKRAEAAAKYQEVISQFGEEAVGPLAKLGLGRIHETEGRHEAAFRLYQELGASGPYDPWAAEANERRQELLAKHPDLAKSLPTAAPVALPGATTPGVVEPKI
jgi:predicted negative regulator of RcsB-dependent stress response